MLRVSMIASAIGYAAAFAPTTMAPTVSTVRTMPGVSMMAKVAPAKKPVKKAKKRKAGE